MLDYFIVGLGLSGAAIASSLEEKGRSFKVFDDGKFSSSKVAGGMMNPVILKRFTLAWNADEQLATANSFYRNLEEKLETHFLKPVELFRKFSSVEEQNNWFEAADNKRLAAFLDTELQFNLNPAIPAEFGFGKVLQAKRLNTQKMLTAYSSYLNGKGDLEEGSFDHQNLSVAENHLEYRGLQARNIIFCEGFGIRNNPYFQYLPLKGNKGEYILIHSPNLRLQETIKASVFISPAGKDIYAVGATYDNSDQSVEPTSTAREELETKLSKLITVPYKVVNQIAGIRPSTIDRRPLVGRHPRHPHLFCCNGFGSRGVLIAPTVAENLLDLVEKGKTLPEEIDLSRFTRKWFGRK